VSDTIKWSELTPKQRDEEIHEKVMGHTRHTVRHEVPSRAGGIAFISSYTTWQTGGQETPRYSQCMDSAWLVVEKMKEPDADPGWEGNRSRFADFSDELVPFAESSSLFDVLWCITPEAICIAALRACGFQVEVQS